MFFCECLNIVGKISESDGTAGRSILRFGGASNMNDLANYQAYEFLKSVNILTLGVLSSSSVRKAKFVCLFVQNKKNENPSHSTTTTKCRRRRKKNSTS